jgi:hypothetical protein
MTYNGRLPGMKWKFGYIIAMYFEDHKRENLLRNMGG